MTDVPIDTPVPARTSSDQYLLWGGEESMSRFGFGAARLRRGCGRGAARLW